LKGCGEECRPPRTARDVTSPWPDAISLPGGVRRRVVAAGNTENGAQGADSLSIGEAAEALGVSVETLRRWSDSGQIRAERTPGGHRRFRVSDVQQALEQERPGRTRSYRLDPPARPLPSLASLLDDGDLDLLAETRRALYSRGPRGWFASDSGTRRTERWLALVARAARTGEYRAAIAGSRELAKQARVAGVSLLECDSFFELLGAAVAREIGNRAPRERATARLLLIVLRQSMLDEYQGVPPGAGLGTGDGGGAAPSELDWAHEDPSLARFLDELVGLYDVEEGAIFLAGEETMDLRLAAFSSVRVEQVGRPPERILLGEGPIGRIALEQRVQMVRGPAWTDPSDPSPGSRALLAAPLRDAGRLVGVICLAARASRPVEERELLLLGALADKIAPAVAGSSTDATSSLGKALARFRAAWSSPTATG
jgi:excisionase family DNA binding protein